MEKLIKILTDPVSNRIIQRMRIKKKMTIAEILAENEKIPRATVYRKVEKMLEVGAIEIVGSRKVRGQTENIYAIKDVFISTSGSREDGLKFATVSILRIIDQFNTYYQSENADVNRDKLFILNYAIALSDTDFSDMMSDILKIVDSYQKKKVASDAKIRNLYLLSAPGGEEL